MVRSQNDLYMVVNNNGAEVNSNNDNTEESVKEGKLTVGELQRAAINICNFILSAPVIERELIDTDLQNITIQFQMIRPSMKYLTLKKTIR